MMRKPIPHSYPQEGDEEDPLTKNKGSSNFFRRHFIHIRRWLAIAGPGLVVMLADTDAGCLITAGQTGMQWGYSCVLLQFILVPIVFIAQELTIRLAIFTHQGQTELIKAHFGKFWAWFAVVCILLTCTGGLCSEISGVTGVGEIFKVPKQLSVGLMAVFLLGIVASGSYRRVEKVALVLGLFELCYLITMFISMPSLDTLIPQVVNLPLANPKYYYIVSANIGAVVMPWMIFYQQSAICDKGLTISDLPYERVDTALGACLTQLIMTSVVMTTASTLWDGNMPSDKSLDNVQDFSMALRTSMGQFSGKILFSMGMLGGSLVGAIVQYSFINSSLVSGRSPGFKTVT
eukprot:NODE_2352_length_1605_cov_54.993252_g2021_i0.p1 GENE.NODE_2352_length_1605_cov_54.993252_g2021_i0~~NODE_2352_length_1605_cov_54.993252_g2021_i0.p1  ORF type:complete len:347 (+),score=6.08 NODE_2352_length_1605_cov_54.993252_g2021_i0:122-1162(+)